MGNFTKQIEEKKERKEKERKEKDRTRREKLAGFFYDLAKLCFGGLVIGSLIAYNNESGGSLQEIAKTLFGLAATLVLSTIANNILK